MSFSINTGNIWTPSASDLTSTDGNGDLFDRDKLPKPDLETEQNMIKVQNTPATLVLGAELMHMETMGMLLKLQGITCLLIESEQTLYKAKKRIERFKCSKEGAKNYLN